MTCRTIQFVAAILAIVAQVVLVMTPGGASVCMRTLDWTFPAETVRIESPDTCPCCQSPADDRSMPSPLENQPCPRGECCVGLPSIDATCQPGERLAPFQPVLVAVMATPVHEPAWCGLSIASWKWRDVRERPPPAVIEALSVVRMLI